MSWWDKVLWKFGRMRQKDMVEQVAHLLTLVCRSCGHGAVHHTTVSLVGGGAMRLRCDHFETPDGLDFEAALRYMDEHDVQPCGCVIEGQLEELFVEETSKQEAE